MACYAHGAAHLIPGYREVVVGSRNYATDYTNSKTGDPTCYLKMTACTPFYMEERMSTEALFWALKQEIPTHPKIILIMLADWFNELEDCAWPSIPELMHKTSQSRSTIIRSTQWLVDHNLVVVENHVSGGWKRSNRYRLAVNVIAIQGVSHRHLKGVTQTPEGCHTDTTIEYTISNTIKDTIISGEPVTQENFPVKVTEKIQTVKDKKLSQDKIFSGAKRKEDKLTPAGCAYIWRHCRHSTSASGFQIELKGKDQSNLQACYKLVGEDFPKIVWDCLDNWIGFTTHAEKTSTAFNSPLNPSIPYFYQHIDAAADYSCGSKGEGFVQLSAIPLKPLTKPKETEDTTSNAMTSDELAAISKELFT